MESINYKDLIQRAKDQDQEAITELYHLTYNLGFYIAQQICRNFDDALDIMQESYIKAFSSLNGLKDPERFPSWLNRIIMNKSRDYLRKIKKVKFADMGSDSDIEEVYDINDDRIEFNPEEFVDYKQTKQILQDILDSLSDEQRLVTLMYYFEEMSIPEMARLLNCKENTIKSRLFYARKKIKESVLELETTGIKLYGALSAAFFTWCLKIDAEAFSMPAEQAQISLEKIVGGIGKMAAITGTAVVVTNTAVKEIFVKATTGLLIGSLVIGGSVAGLSIYNKNIHKLPMLETQVELEQAAVPVTEETQETQYVRPREIQISETRVDYSRLDISEILRDDIVVETNNLKIRLPQFITDTEGSRAVNEEIQDIYNEYIENAPPKR